jgi:hypothetical protein
MYMCKYIYIYICICVYAYICIYICINIYIHIYIGQETGDGNDAAFIINYQPNANEYRRLFYLFTSISLVGIHKHIYLCMYVFINVYISIYIYVFVYI